MRTRRTAATVLVALVLVVAFAWQASSQPSQGFGPVFDPVNNALRVNTVAGSATISISNINISTATFGNAFPFGGIAGGFKDANGAFASITTSNGLPVNIVAGGGSSSLASATFGNAFPSGGIPGGYRDSSGAFASFTGNNGRLNVIVGTDSTLIATVTSSALPTGAATDASVLLTRTSVDNVESAIRETTAVWNTTLPIAAVTVGAKDPNGLVASLTTSSTGRLQVTCDNCSSTASNFGTAFPSSGAALGYRDALGAFASVTLANGLPVNIVAGGTSGGSLASATFGNAFPSGGIPNGYRDALGAFASFTGANGRLNVIVGNESTIIATVTGTVTANQGASATAANLWPVSIPSDSGVMVRPGDDTNKAVRVNVVAGGGSSSLASATFGNAFPSGGIPGGYRDSSGAFASLAGANGAFGSINYDSAGREVGSALPGKQNVPVGVQDAPKLPDKRITLGARQTTIVNVPQGQPAGMPLQGMSVGGGLGTQGWATPWIRCDRTASISVSNSGFTQVVAAAAGKSIYVCGYTFTVGTTPVGVAFGDGTGTDCSTSSSDLTGAMAQAASGGIVNSASPVVQFETRPGNALCVKLSNGAPIGGHLRYTQF